MAILQADAAFSLSNLNFSGALGEGVTFDPWPNEYVVHLPSGEELHFTGKDFSYVRFTGDTDNLLDSGTITGFRLVKDGVTEVSISRFSYTASGFEDFLDGYWPVKDWAGAVFSRRDALIGSPRADTLEGFLGNDKIAGNRGADILIGDWGKDLLTGGAGSDVFEFSKIVNGTGEDTITDFHATANAHDTIDLSGFRWIASYSDLKGHIHATDSGVDIDLGHSSEIHLLEVKLRNIDASDFTFG